jgi:hypothetical protein
VSDLFNRDIVVVVNTIRIASRGLDDDPTLPTVKPLLKMSFSVEKSANRDPNKAEVKIWNLTSEHRASLQKDQPLIIEAGYVGTTEQLFSGDITFVSHVREATDWITTVQCGDGAKQYSSARMNQSFGPGTQMSALLKGAADSLGVGLGNAAQKFSSGNFRGGLTEFTRGVTVSGRASDVLDKYCTTAGFQWSIQDGQLQVLQPNETTQQDVLSLTADSGLIGSPEVGEGGVVKAKCLLLGGLMPGRKCHIKSALIDGFFKLEKTKHFGDTWGQDWYSDLEGRPL